MSQTFGQYLNDHRTKTGLSANALSRLLGISNTYLNDIEDGHKPPLSPIKVNFSYLAKQINCDETELRLLAAAGRGALEIPFTTEADAESLLRFVDGK